MRDLVGKRLGDFEVVRELGRGGMGVVYEARQVSLNRQVALKVLAGGLGLTPKAVQRFHREAEAAAKLYHTNIVPVYATGEHDGTHFYAMELIDGSSLDLVIRQMRHATADQPPPDPTAPEAAAALGTTGPYAPPATATPFAGGTSLSSGGQYFDTVARLVADVADALEHAHKNGVIHRDIKPSNLLLSQAGRLSVNDFGLARVLEQPGVTLSGEFVGTPAYMSPEQVAAGRVPLDQRTDIYSLGATLYELLTLEPPFRGRSRDEVLGQIVQKDPRPPRKLNKKAPVDLETICLKCLEKDPDRRYQTAGAMAEDLRRYVNRFAIAARRPGPVTRLRKWLRRNPALAASIACALAAAVIAALVAYRSHVVGQEGLAEQQRLEQQLRQEQRQSAVERAILEAMSGDTQVALQAIAEAESKGAEPGQLNLLRGLVEYHRGRAKEAIVYLEQAERQMPESVAVKATLACAFVVTGRWQRYDEMLSILERLEPQTPEDYLLLALSQQELDPEQALRTLDRAPTRSRHSAVALFIRAWVQIALVQETGRPEDAEKSLEDLRKVDLPEGSQEVPFAQVMAHVAAAHAYRSNARRREDALIQAGRAAERLA
jgi:serine/threonine protein kinase